MYNFPEEHMRDERNYGIVVFDFYFHYRKNYTYIYVHILSRKIYIYIYIMYINDIIGIFFCGLYTMYCAILRRKGREKLPEKSWCMYVL